MGGVLPKTGNGETPLAVLLSVFKGFQEMPPKPGIIRELDSNSSTEPGD